MDRKGFLKMMDVGAIGSALVPSVLKAKTRKDNTITPSVAIDVASITHFTIGGIRVSAAEIMQIYKQTGILIYNSKYGNAPMVLEGEIEVIDFKNKV